MRIQFTKPDTSGDSITVILERKKVGEIRKVAGGFQYFPKTDTRNRLVEEKGGEVFPTLKGVMDSLQSD